MDKITTILDREQLSSDYIHSKQDFGKVVKGVKTAKQPIWKSPWFYGVTGVSVVAFVVAISLHSPVEEKGDVETQLASRPEIKSKIDHVDKVLPASNVVPKSNEQHYSSNSITEINRSNPGQSSIESVSVNNSEKVFAESNETAITESQATTAANQDPPKNMRSSNVIMPHIGDYYTGEIPVELLCSGETISATKDLAVTSFKIQYYDGAEEVEKAVRGNAIPNEICQNLGKYNLNLQVRITSIKAEDRFSGTVHTLPAMNFTPVLAN